MSRDGALAFDSDAGARRPLRAWTAGYRESESASAVVPWFAERWMGEKMAVLPAALLKRAGLRPPGNRTDSNHDLQRSRGG